MINRPSRFLSRFVIAAAALMAGGLMTAPGALAQADGGWTLNVDNTGFNPIPAGGLLPYSVRIDNNSNGSTPATEITFTIPASAEFLGVDGLNNCLPSPVSGQPATVTCAVPALALGGLVNATVNLRPMEAGTIELLSTMIPPGPSFPRSTTILRGADLALDLRVVESPVLAGSLARFKATVTNNGPHPSDNAVLVIPVPTGLSSNVTVPPGCAIASNTITCNLATPINVGSVIELDFSAQVIAANTSTITVAGAVSSTSPRDGVSGNNDATADIDVQPGTDVALSKTRSPQGLILVGDTVTFTLTPSFAGFAPDDARIEDIVPANYEILSVTPASGSGWTCPSGLDQTIVCEYVAAAGTSYPAPIVIETRAITATAPDVGITNTATISSTSEQSDAQGNNFANDGAAFIAIPTVDLEALKGGPPRGLVTVANSYDFTLRARNLGNAGFHGRMTITDHVPDGLTITATNLPSGWFCDDVLPLAGEADLNCWTDNYTPASPLGPSQSTPIITLTAEVTGTGSISNGMTVSYPGYDGPGGDVDLSNNTTTTGVTSADSSNWADISVIKQQLTPTPGDSITSGGELSFSIEIINAGPVAALNVVLDDRLQDVVGSATGGEPDPQDIEVQHTLGNASGMTCTVPASSDFSSDMQCIIPSLPVCTQGSDCPVVTVKMRTGGEGIKTNTAIAFSTQTPDNNTNNNSDGFDYTVDRLTDVTVDKSSPASATDAVAGQELVYVLTARVPRTGLSGAQNVSITDTLPEGLVFQGAVASGGGTCSVSPALGSITGSGNDALTCAWAEIANGSQQTVTVRVVPTTALADTMVTNNVEISTSTTETDSTNNSDSLSINITPPELDLIISKTDNVDPLQIGADTTYSIILNNTGPSDAFDVQVVDTLPVTGLANPRFTLVEGDGACVLAGDSQTSPGGTLNCTFARVPANSDVRISLVMEGVARGRHTNNVTVTSAETVAGFETHAANNSAFEDTTVRERVDLLVTKVPSVSVVDLRQEFYWDITVTNQAETGLGIADDVTLVDTLPEGMELTRLPEIVAGNAICTAVIGGREITCRLGDMASGAIDIIRLHTKITLLSAQSAENSATATTPSFEQNPGDNTGTGSVTTVQGSGISGTLYRDFDNSRTKDPEDTGISGITITASGVAVHDGATITATTTSNADGTYSFTALPPGTYSVSYGTISEAHLNDGQAVPGENENAPHPTSGAVNRIDGIVITNSFSAVEQDFTRVPVARIGIGKVAGAVLVQPDGSLYIPYTLTVENFSLEPLIDVEITDVLDDDAQNFGDYVSGTPVEGEYTVLNHNGGAFGSLQASFNGANNTTLLTGGTLAAGATGTVGFTVHVYPAMPRAVPALTYTNQADISGIGDYSRQTPTDLSNNTSNPDPNNNGRADDTGEDTPTTVTFVPTASVTIDKTATPVRTTGEAAVGDRIDYSFTVTNTGETPLLNVTVTDPLPNLQWLSEAPIPRLERGEDNSTNYSAYYLLTQDDIDAGALPNTATVTGQWGDNNGTPVNVTNTDSASVGSLSDPGLTIVKTLESDADIGNPRTEIGDIARFKFVVQNTGNTTLNNVIITDALAGVLPDPDTNAFDLGTIAPGAPEIVVYADYPVKQADIDAGTVTNSAIASGTYGPANTPISTPSSSVNVPLYQEPGLTLTKTLRSTLPTVPRDGAPIEWTVTAQNTGNVTLTDLVVTDPFPGAVVSPASIPSLAPGLTADFVVTAALRQQDIDALEVENTATINFDDPSGPQPPVDADVTVPLPAHSPAIALSKNGDVSGLSTPPLVGETITYTIVIRNTGNVALDNITLTDLLDDVVLDAADMAVLSTTVLQPQNAAGTVPTSETDITINATYALKIEDIEAGQVVNTAVTVGQSVPDPATTVTDRGGTTFETDDPTTTVLLRDPQISLVKSITSADLSNPPQVGDLITYGFAIENTGNVTLTDIELIDAVVDVEIANPTNWSGPLIPGDTNTTAFTATYRITQADIDAGVFDNDASVSGTGTDSSGLPTIVSDSSVASQLLAQTSSLSIVKDATASLTSPPAEGDIIEYTFVLTNTGNTTLTNVILSDPLPGLVMNDATTIATLLPGAANAQTITAAYSVLQADIQRGDVTNQASATYDDVTGPQGPETSNQVVVPLTQVPGIAIVKEASSALSDPALVGEIITYSFTVTNTGNLVLTGVVFDDPLPGLTPSSFAVGTLAPGEVSAVFTATYAIDAADIAAGEVVNQATATGTYDDGSGPQTIDDLSGPTILTDEPVIVPVLPEAPALVVVKTASFSNGGGYTRVGDVIEYQFVVTNTGNVTLSDVTPRELELTFGGLPPAGALEPITPGPQVVAPSDQATFTTRYVLTQDDINHAAGISDGVSNRADATAQYVGSPVLAPPDTALLSIPAQEPANISIVKRALVSAIRRGETAPFLITVTNNSLADVGLISITDRLPNGFAFVEGSGTVNGASVTPAIAGQSVTFSNVRLGPNSSVEIGLVLRALPTTPAGLYRNTALGVDAMGTPLSPPAHADIRIEAEAVFECSDVIGTVFNDYNRNGYQDEGEPGIPGVRLSTVRGTLITTDAFGRYSVPCADLPNGNIGSNFVLKIDERTLPTGFSLTSDNPGMVRLTAGKMVELNFGVSIGREIVLRLDSSAFTSGGTTPTSALFTGLDQLVSLLVEERTTLFVIYQRASGGAEARQRVDHLVTLIREKWRQAGEPYRLVINTDIVEN